MLRPAGVFASVAMVLSGLSAVRCADEIDITLGTAERSGRLPTNFASFSYEVECAIQMFSNGGKPRQSFVALLQNLQAVSAESGPNIRVGGNSADQSVYIPANQPLPINDTYRITDADFQSYLAAVPLWNGSVTLGLNFRNSTSPALALAHVKAAIQVLPVSLVEGLEVGNECDLYNGNGIRPSTFDYTQYASQFDSYQAAIGATGAIQYPRIQGATFCCSRFDSGLPGYISKYGTAKVLSSVSYHNYPLNNCNRKNDNNVYELLDDNAATSGATHVTPFAQAARAVSIPFYIGEGNSVACGGQYNVSDVFGAALWSIDVMFNIAAIGGTRWNFHGCPEGAYTAIAYPNINSNVPDVRPLYYGMWAFTVATAHHATLQGWTINHSTNTMVKTWPTLDSRGTWRVVILHKDANATAAASVTVRPPPAVSVASNATLVRLAPASGGVHAKYGITFGGLTFDGSQVRASHCDKAFTSTCMSLMCVKLGLPYGLHHSACSPACRCICMHD